MLSDDRLIGMQFLWFAVDSRDTLALFNTAGGGYVPATVLDVSDAVYDEMLGWAIETPIVGTGMAIDRDCDSEWLEFAGRGLTGFDWVGVYGHGSGSTYSRVAAPTVPITIEALPAGLRAYVARTRFASIVFASCDALCVQRSLAGGPEDASGRP